MRNPGGLPGQPGRNIGLFYRITRKQWICVVLLAFTLTAAGCRTESEAQKEKTPLPSSSRNPAMNGARVAAQPPGQDDGQWLMPAKNYASTRYSELGQINAQNVNNLKVAWTFSTGNTRGHEAAPLIVGGTMYVVAPFPNYLYALDLANSGAAQVGLQAAGRPRGPGGRLLRPRQPRRGVRQRQDLLQHARRPDGGGRRRDRPGGLAHAARRHQQGRDRSPWRRWWSRARSWSATAAASSASAAG